MRAAAMLASAELIGVGTGALVSSVQRISIQVRKSLSDEEIATLSPEWLAIPARDEFSMDGEMEMRL